MTVPRALLLLCAVVALAHGAVWEALGYVLAVVVLVLWGPGRAAVRVGVCAVWVRGGWR